MSPEGTSLRGPSLLIWVVGAAVLVFLLWARFAWVDEIIRAEGEVVSAARPQVIQNLEGGILSELLVGEGDRVAQGDVLARLGATQFASEVEDLRARIDAADIRRHRLEAEMGGQFDFTVPAELAARAPDMLASERALLAARQSDYVTRTDGAQRLLEETAGERDRMEAMLAEEIVALIEVTRARKAHSDALTALAEIRTGAEMQRASAFSEVLAELASLRQDLRGAQDRLSRTVIRSPMAGVIKALGVTTIGGVVRPGEALAEIIPTGDDLFIEARVLPKDIAPVAVGQKANVKLSAYDYTQWGSLVGRVELVSADSFKDDRRPEHPAHYKVSVSIDRSALTGRQAGIDLRPGLQAVVELHTGRKTVLTYLTKPLYRARDALHEP